MPIAYDSGWDSAREAFADDPQVQSLYTEDMVSLALWKKNGCGEDVQELVNAGFKYPNETVYVGPDPSGPSPADEPFSLPLVLRWRSRSWNLRLVQDGSGELTVESWSGEPPRRKVVRRKQYYFGRG